MTCKISAKINSGDRTEVFISQILYLLSDIIAVFFWEDY